MSFEIKEIQTTAFDTMSSAYINEWVFAKFRSLIL